MCGICGLIQSSGELPDQTLLERMMERLKHRGNDAHGLKRFPHAGLGHQRLSILDISEKADQPFSSPDTRYWITFNGEIYNFPDLKQQLEKTGPFFTTSDTEVLLRGFITWGSDVLAHLNGMFAFAIWDTHTRTLFCARDRFGVKPFHYFFNESLFVFASEIKALLVHPAVSRHLDPRAVSDYLSLGYITGEKTIFSCIRKLLPGHELRLSPGQAPEIREYWDLRPPFPDVSAEGMVAGIRQRLESASQSRLISDVPVGFFLSGGIDSSAITGYALRHQSRLETFSLGFDHETFSELDAVRRFTRDLPVVRHGVTFGAPDEALLRRLAWHYDQPFADTSSVPTFFLSGFTSKFVKVVLSGDGGDEMFGGYETNRADIAAALGQRVIPGWNPLLAAARGLWARRSVDFGKVSLDYKIRQFLGHAHLPPPQAHYSWRLLFDEVWKGRLMSDALKADLDEYSPFDEFSRLYKKVEDRTIFAQHMYVDLKTWLADDILVKVDIASMAHGLEVRCPFLDVHLAEYAAGLPYRAKANLLGTKQILKKAVADVVPDWMLKRKKEGFNSPVSHWLRRDLKPLLTRTLAGDAFRHLFPNRQVIEDIITEHESGRRDWGHPLWALFMFGLWSEHYLP